MYVCVCVLHVNICITRLWCFQYQIEEETDRFMGLLKPLFGQVLK